MAAEEDKGGGFGSLPGDLFENLITYFADPKTQLSQKLEQHRLPILNQLARAEHAAANATKNPYVVDVVFKCVSIQSDFLTAKDAGAATPEQAREDAMVNIENTLHALKGLWV